VLAAFIAALQLVRLNDVEVALVVLIPFVASPMSRGIWLF
jgi:hypothetical protein